MFREGRVFQVDRSSDDDPASPPTLLALIGFVGLCLLVGVADGALTARSVSGWYASLTAPPGTAPKWLFVAGWVAVYVLLGTAAWLVWRRPALGTRRALLLWGWQLLVNAAWTPVFFGLHSPELALVVILVLLVLIAWLLRAFLRLRPLAAALLMPYAAWTCYAAYLNAGFVWLNSG